MEDDRLRERTIEEIRELVDAVRECTLPFEEWHHHEHLIVAMWYLEHHSLEEATDVVRANILRYNRKNNVEQTQESGYHETLTVFFMKFIQKFRVSLDASLPLEEKVARMLKGYCKTSKGI